jgi:nicotinamidase-related amidase
VETTAVQATALLIMDVQVGVVARLEAGQDLPARLARASAAARQAGVPVIYVAAGYLPGHPEIGERSPEVFRQLRELGAMVIGDPAAALHPGLDAGPDPVIVTKKRYGAFSGSELDTVLRANDHHHLVLAGIVTSGVVLSTVRQAFDLDYRLTVLSDGCVDYDNDVHRVLTEKVFPRQAAVLTIDEWVAQLGEV